MTKTRLTRRVRTGEVITLEVNGETIELEVGRLQTGSAAITIVSSPEVKITRSPESNNDRE